MFLKDETKETILLALKITLLYAVTVGLALALSNTV